MTHICVSWPSHYCLAPVWVIMWTTLSDFRLRYTAHPSHVCTPRISSMTTHLWLPHPQTNSNHVHCIIRSPYLPHNRHIPPPRPLLISSSSVHLWLHDYQTTSNHVHSIISSFAHHISHPLQFRTPSYLLNRCSPVVMVCVPGRVHTGTIFLGWPRCRGSSMRPYNK